jgi:hypothetical protein
VNSKPSNKEGHNNKQCKNGTKLLQDIEVGVSGIVESRQDLHPIEIYETESAKCKKVEPVDEQLSKQEWSQVTIPLLGEGVEHFLHWEEYVLSEIASQL